MINGSDAIDNVKDKLYSRFREGDKRFHRHRFDDFHVFVGHAAARGDGLFGYRVGRSRHLFAVVDLIAHDDLIKPFTRNRGGPAGAH